jgi:hypothetical protein
MRYSRFARLFVIASLSALALPGCSKGTDGKTHKLQVRVDGSRFQVRSRDSYLAVPDRSVR